MSKTPVAILCSDPHFRHTVPSGRGDRSWYPVMDRVWTPIRELAHRYNIPTFIAGDILHRWDGVTSPPELINWVMDEALPPNTYAVPGQHDLPQHSLAQKHRSGYHTLVAAGAIQDLTPDPTMVGLVGKRPIMVSGFPWEVPVTPVPEFTRQKFASEDPIYLAVIHAYIHKGGETAHINADEGARLDCWAERLEGYDVALFGDNHCHFRGMAGNCLVINNGGMMLTATDTRDYTPHYHVLFDDGSVETRDIDVSEDVWAGTTAVQRVAAQTGAGLDFARMLATAQTEVVDFDTAVRAAVAQGYDPEVCVIVDEVLRNAQPKVT